MNGLTLSITKIGDLLLRGRISRDKDEKSIQDIKLSIPNYQRPYKWSARNAIQQLVDSIEADKNGGGRKRKGSNFKRKGR